MRSIGDRADDIDVGDVDVTQGSKVVTGNNGTMWLTNNRGRGDTFTIDNVKYYVIRSVDSDTQLTLTSAYDEATQSGFPTYTIARQFPTLVAWEDCVDGGPCVNGPPASSTSLVNDERSEIGIAFKDPTVFTNVLISGMTTDVNHTVTLTADAGNRHFGIAGSPNAVIVSIAAGHIIDIRTDFATVEWLEVDGQTTAGNGVHITSINPSNQLLIRNMVIHDAGGRGIRSLDADANTDIFNNIIYNSGFSGILLSANVPRTINNTIFNSGNLGISANGIVSNNISHTNIGADYAGAVHASSTDNLSEDGTAPGSNKETGVCLSGAMCVNFKDDMAPGIDLHLLGTSFAIDKGADLSNILTFDIDGGGRKTPWDIGADDVEATTAVELVRFEASGANGSVELVWETGSEIDNLGFDLYRSTFPARPYTRITERPIPGLGSSPAGARYRFLDTAVENDVTYWYELEDIETTGETERHGPVSAIPRAGGATQTSPVRSRITYGEPENNTLRVVSRARRHVVLDLRTEGFYAEPQDDGSVKLIVPGLELFGEPGAPAIPVARQWVEALARRHVEIVSVRAVAVESFNGLRPSNVDAPELQATRQGAVRASSRRVTGFHRAGLYPNDAARILEVGFQQETKKALVELAPMRWDPTSGQLLLAKRLIVRLAFRGRDRSEQTRDGVKGRRRRASQGDGRSVFARLVTQEPGLYGVNQLPPA